MKNIKTLLFATCMLCLGSIQAQFFNLSLYGNGPIGQNTCSDIGKITAEASISTAQIQGVLWSYSFIWYKNGAQVHTDGQGPFLVYPFNKVSTLNSSHTQMTSGTYTVEFKLYKTINGSVQLYASDTKTITQEFYSSIPSLDANLIKGTVSGDFDSDGFEDDIVAFSESPSSSSTSVLYGWISDGSKMTFDKDNGWWSEPWYDPNKVDGRVVSLDFDNDGVKNDIAAIQDLGNNTTSIDIWSPQMGANGVSLLYHGSKWQSTAYNALKVTHRVVSGDFDSDTYHDDIAVLYDYGASTTQIHLFISDGSTFTFHSGWHSGAGMFNANQVSGRIVSGDFDNDTYHNDIITYYDYTNVSVNAFLFRDVQNTTQYETWWSSGIGNYNGGSIIGNVVAADFDDDGHYDDIATIYDYGSSYTAVHNWRSEGSSLSGYWTSYVSVPGNFNALKTAYRTVTGDFDNDGVIDDVNAIYSYNTVETAIFQWENIKPESNASLVKTWETCNIPGTPRLKSFASEPISPEEQEQFDLYPNPTSGVVNIRLQEAENALVEIYNTQGQKVMTKNVSNGNPSVDIHDLSKGIYLVNVVIDGQRKIQKLMVE